MTQKEKKRIRALKEENRLLKKKVDEYEKCHKPEVTGNVKKIDIKELSIKILILSILVVSVFCVEEKILPRVIDFFYTEERYNKYFDAFIESNNKQEVINYLENMNSNQGVINDFYKSESGSYIVGVGVNAVSSGDFIEYDGFGKISGMFEVKIPQDTIFFREYLLSRLRQSYYIDIIASVGILEIFVRKKKICKEMAIILGVYAIPILFVIGAMSFYNINWDLTELACLKCPKVIFLAISAWSLVPNKIKIQKGTV